MQKGLLFPIPSESFAQLNKILEQRLPFSALLRNMLQLEINNKWSENFHVQFYSTNLEFGTTGTKGEIRNQDTNEKLNDSLIIVATQTFKYFREKVVLFSTPNSPSSTFEPEQILTILNDFIDWSAPIIFGDVPEQLSYKLVELYQLKNGRQDDGTVDLVRFYKMNVQDGLNFDTTTKGLLKNGLEFEIKPLTALDCTIVDQSWNECRPGTSELVKDSVETVGSAGVYLVDGTKTELASWVVTSPVGSINMLHTKPDYRRLGLGELALRSIVHLNSTNGLISVAHVHEDNVMSQNVMDKVGLEFTHRVSWITFRGINLVNQ